MSDDGYGLGDERQEKLSEEEYDSENTDEETESSDDENESNEPSTKNDLNAELRLPTIINERNKIHHEFYARIPGYKDDVGRIDVDLFGDPRNPDLISRLQELEEELDHPATKRHPITAKFHRFIDNVKRIKIIYSKMNQEYHRYFVEMGKLLDNSIRLHSALENRYSKLYNEMKSKYETQILNLKTKIPESKPDILVMPDNSTVELPKHSVTKKLVEQFLQEEGQELINQYIYAKRADNPEAYKAAKTSFYTKAAGFFAPYHADPKNVAKIIWNKQLPLSLNAVR